MQTMAPRKMTQGKNAAAGGGKASSRKHQIRDDEQLTAADIAGASVQDDEGDARKKGDAAVASVFWASRHRA